MARGLVSLDLWQPPCFLEGCKRMCRQNSPGMGRGTFAGATTLVVLAAAILSGCSFRTYAVNALADALATSGSVYESDSDIELVGEALPFGLKLMESLLAETPNHQGLLLTACRGFTLYSYAYVDIPADAIAEQDIDRAREMRARARRLYERATAYCLRSLERTYEGIEAELLSDPGRAVRGIAGGHEARDLPLLYWTAASLGLAISVSPGSASLLARLPEVEALLSRALQLNESWNAGALHEFMVVFAGAAPGGNDVETIRYHYNRALELSGGRSASLHVAYAEAVSVPTQNGVEFRETLQRALAVDPDAFPENRLVNMISQGRAVWLLDRVEDLFLE